MAQRHMVIVAGELNYLIRFRTRLLERLIASGVKVTLVTPNDPTPYAQLLVEKGVEHRRIPFSRAGMNPVSDSARTWEAYRLFREIEPTDVFAYSAKAILVGLTAAALRRVPRTYAMLAGLGYAFLESDPTARRTISRFVQVSGFRLLLTRARSVIFHNPDDRDLLVRAGAVRRSSAVVVPGSGVDVEQFTASPAPVDPVRFVFVGRLLKAKGVMELLMAAEGLKQQVPSAEVHLVGGADANPESIDPATLKEAERNGYVVLHGQVADVRPLLRAASAFVLPSYREGLPRSALEALAMGRTAIVTDVPGCREVVNPGEYGALVAPRDATDLRKVLIEYATDPYRLVREGALARKAAEERFSDVKVNAQMLRALEVD